MKNKKILIIFLVAIILFAILIAILKPVYDTYVFRNLNKKELLESLENIEDLEERNAQIDSALERKWITSKEAENIRSKP